VSPGVHFHPSRRPSAVHQLRACSACTEGPARSSRKRPGMSSAGPASLPDDTIELCGFPAGLRHPFFLIAGPCVIESRQMAFDTAGALKELAARLQIPFIYKSSFDKANRSSGTSFRGPGMDEGLEILAAVRAELNVPVLTDVHETSQVAAVAQVVDVLQTPAFLCRQTDFIRACAASGKPVNIKKGQFLAPHDMQQVALKARDAAIEAGGD